MRKRLAIISIRKSTETIWKKTTFWEVTLIKKQIKSEFSYEHFKYCNNDNNNTKTALFTCTWYSGLPSYPAPKVCMLLLLFNRTGVSRWCYLPVYLMEQVLFTCLLNWYGVYLPAGGWRCRTVRVGSVRRWRWMTAGGLGQSEGPRSPGNSSPLCTCHWTPGGRRHPGPRPPERRLTPAELRAGALIVKVWRRAQSWPSAVLTGQLIGRTLRLQLLFCFSQFDFQLYLSSNTAAPNIWSNILSNIHLISGQMLKTQNCAFITLASSWDPPVKKKKKKILCRAAGGWGPTYGREAGAKQTTSHTHTYKQLSHQLTKITGLWTEMGSWNWNPHRGRENVQLHKDLPEPSGCETPARGPPCFYFILFPSLGPSVIKPNIGFDHGVAQWLIWLIDQFWISTLNNTAEVT